MKKLLFTISFIACSLLSAQSPTPKKPCHLYSTLKKETLNKLTILKQNANHFIRSSIDDKRFASALALGVISYECQNGRKTSPEGRAEDHGPATEILRNLGFLNKEGFIYREICECLVAESDEECQL